MKLLYRIQVIAMTVAMILCISNIFFITKTYANDVIASETTLKIAKEETDANSGSSSDDDLMTIDNSNSKKVYQGNSTVNGITSKILGAITTICYAAAVIAVLVKGVQVAMAAPDQKAKVSEQLIGVVIGGIILFTIGSIVKIVADLSQKVIE